MLSVICILCVALALWLAATLFLWHRELLEIQKTLEDIGAGNLNRRIVTRGPQAIRSIGYGINKIVKLLKDVSKQKWHCNFKNEWEWFPCSKVFCQFLR